MSLKKRKLRTIKVNREKVKEKHFNPIELVVIFREEGHDCWKGKKYCPKYKYIGYKAKVTVQHFLPDTIWFVPISQKVSASVMPDTHESRMGKSCRLQGKATLDNSWGAWIYFMCLWHEVFGRRKWFLQSGLGLSGGFV